ncbi:MAG: universal stress protein [Treponema sp.]|jgi:nucleotide-binding universal stress UspA family protein|nr:universal stress protein [Treponema sp.]
MTKNLISDLVVGINGSDASILAAKYAIVLAKQQHCRLTAVYVVDTATIRQLTLSKIFIQEESQEYEHSLEANGHRYLSYIGELARPKGVKVDREIRHGAVYTEILKIADEKKANLILLGGWERDRSTRDIMGNSYREVMVNAKCSVLLVKEPSIDQLYKLA